jgi:ATP adenylyltransferase
MVVPYQHVESLEMLDADTRCELMELTNQCIQVLRAVYQPQGFNLGGNIGQAAGAGVADHIHLHVLPRWTGDTNFMTSVGGTRILPETVHDSWERIQKAWK